MNRRVPYRDAFEAWHFCAESLRLRTFGRTPADSPALIVAPGYVYTETDSPIVVGQNGMHGAEDAVTALLYAAGPVVCRVRLYGETAKAVLHPPIIASRHREVLWMADASRTLREWALWAIREVRLGEDGTGPTVVESMTDPRALYAVETTERWLRGEAPDKLRAKACVAVWRSFRERRDDREVAVQANAAAYHVSGAVSYSSAIMTLRNVLNAALNFTGAYRGEKRVQDILSAELEWRLLALEPGKAGR